MSPDLTDLAQRLERLRQPCVARSTERRSGHLALRFPERRDGFDRRIEHLCSPLARARESLLLAYRDHTLALAVVLVLANLANAADLAMTERALSLGAMEANPVLAPLFASNPLMAAAFKLGVCLAVSAAIWRMRRYRSMLVASFALAGAFAGVMVYQVWLASAV